MNPGEQARAIVRAGLHDTRVWLGETTPEAESYHAKHARGVTPVTTTPRGVTTFTWRHLHMEEVPCH